MKVRMLPSLMVLASLFVLSVGCSVAPAVKETFEFASGYEHAHLHIVSEKLTTPGVLRVPVPARHSSPESYSDELREFVEAVRGSTDRWYTGQEGRADIQVIEAAMRSVDADGARVAIE